MSASKWKLYPQHQEETLLTGESLPMHWNLKRLKFSASLNAGQSPPSSDVVEFKHGLLPFLQGNAEFGINHPNPLNACNSPPKVANLGDILLSVRAPVGAMNKADQSYGIGRGLCAIKFDKKFDDRYGFHLLIHIKESLKMFERGSTYKAVTREDIGELVCAQPPLDEQILIGRFAESINSKISGLANILSSKLALLNENRSAIITQAVTKGLNTDVPLKDSGIKSIGMIPSHWEVVTAKHLEKNTAEFVQTGPFGAQLHASDYIEDEINGIPLILIKNVRDLKISSHGIPRISRDKAESLSLYRLKKDDIVFSRVGSVGRIAKVSRNEVGWLISGQMLRLRFTTNRINTDYAVFSISSESILNYFKLQSVGTTRDSINSTILSEMPIIVPPVEEQEQIVKYLEEKNESFRKAINLVSKQLSILTEYKKALNSAAVTGKIDLRGL